MKKCLVISHQGNAIQNYKKKKKSSHISQYGYYKKKNKIKPTPSPPPEKTIRNANKDVKKKELLHYCWECELQ